MHNFLLIPVMIWLIACNPTQPAVDSKSTSGFQQNTPLVVDGDTIPKVIKTEEEWKAELNEKEFYVLRKAGTERAFTGDLWDNKEEGIYTCRGCQLPLFESATKYKSGTGWPSFWQPIKKEHSAEDSDYNRGYKRTEVRCARCGGHLGHVFEDGPEPTGLRYCINSVSMDFVKE